jgi:hypothetical protein
MSTSPENINSEKTPLLNSDIHESPPITIRSDSRNDPGTSTEGVAPCAKYGNQEDLAKSTIHNTKRARRKLIIACVICVFFLVGEFVGGLYIILSN